MTKIDLQSAYRSVSISKHSQRVTGLKWQFGNTTVFLPDKKLCFGSRYAPGIFQRLTQAVKRMLKRQGLDAVVVYLDDFFIKADTLANCAAALDTTIKLLRKLGFQINWNKVIDPCTKLTFLGIEIDSIEMCLRFPNDNLVKVRKELALFQKRKRLSKNSCNPLLGNSVFAQAWYMAAECPIINAINSM